MRARILYVFGMVALALSLFVGTVGAQTSWLELRNDVRIFGRQLVDGNARFLGSVEIDGSVTVDGALSGRLPVYTGTVTSGGPVDCTRGGFLKLSAAGNVGTATFVTTTVEGIPCYVVNVSNVTMTFTDTGVLKLSGNAALGQHDTLILMSYASGWVEFSETNN